MWRNLLPLAVRCANTSHLLGADQLPWCHDCLRRMPACPEICPHCFKILNPRCTSLHPRSSPLLRLQAHYLGSTHALGLVKRWKRNPSPFSTQKLIEARTLIPPDRPYDFLVPIPRSVIAHPETWPATQLAHFLVKAGHAPSVSFALKLNRHGFEPKQALLSAQERRFSPNKWALQDSAFEMVGKSVCLVDDFITTGKTISDAAQWLITAGAATVSAWVLCFRPSFQSDATASIAALGPNASVTQ